MLQKGATQELQLEAERPVNIIFFSVYPTCSCMIR